jgi:hypothetical protein
VKSSRTNTIGPSVVFARVDPEKNEVFLKAHSDQAWKVFKDVKYADDIIQINGKTWVDRFHWRPEMGFLDVPMPDGASEGVRNIPDLPGSQLVGWAKAPRAL